MRVLMNGSKTKATTAISVHSVVVCKFARTCCLGHYTLLIKISTFEVLEREDTHCTPTWQNHPFPISVRSRLAISVPPQCDLHAHRAEKI